MRTTTDFQVAAVIKAVGTVPTLRESRMSRVTLTVLAEAIADDFENADFSDIFDRGQFLRECGL
jgi:hypothetical protein